MTPTYRRSVLSAATAEDKLGGAHPQQQPEKPQDPQKPNGSRQADVGRRGGGTGGCFRARGPPGPSISQRIYRSNPSGYPTRKPWTFQKPGAPTATPLCPAR